MPRAVYEGGLSGCTPEDLVVKRAATAAGLNPRIYVGHSLRSGLATAAIQAGVSERAIMEQTGHKSLPVVRRYIRCGSLFTENATARVGLGPLRLACSLAAFVLQPRLAAALAVAFRRHSSAESRSPASGAGFRAEGMPEWQPARLPAGRPPMLRPWSCAPRPRRVRPARARGSRKLYPWESEPRDCPRPSPAPVPRHPRRGTRAQGSAGCGGAAASHPARGNAHGAAGTPCDRAGRAARCARAPVARALDHRAARPPARHLVFVHAHPPRWSAHRAAIKRRTPPPGRRLAGAGGPIPATRRDTASRP